MKKEQVVILAGVEPRKCMKCGKCTATCPNGNEMDYKPHQFVYMVEKGEIEPLLNSNSLFKCLSCFACIERCPRGVEPARFIEAIRTMKIRKQGENHLKADMIPELLDDQLPQQAIVTAFRKFSR